MSHHASREFVASVLERLLQRRRLNNIPRNPVQRDILLAALCGAMRRRHPYMESEVNELLRQRLATLTGPVDHVTCRRYLVDVGLIKRDRAGARYFLNYPKLQSVLSDDALVYVNGFFDNVA